MSKREKHNHPPRFEFDVALSFSGEDRKIAQELAALLREKQVTVFYDFDARAELWGKDHRHLQSIYRDKARYCIVLVSKAYTKTPWTRYEFRHAQARAFQQDDEYLLPLRLDDTELPGLNSTDIHIDLRVVDLQEVCDLIVTKLREFGPEVHAKWTGHAKQPPTISSRQSLSSIVLGAARTRINRLMLIWIQLMLVSYLLAAIANPIIGGHVIVSLLPVFPVSIAVSRLVRRDLLSSYLVGGLVGATLMGTLMFGLSDSAVPIASLCGAIYGSFLTGYFSRADKHTTLFMAILSTFFVVGILWFVLCSSSHLTCLELLRDEMGDSSRLAAFTLTIGCLLYLLVKPMTYVIDGLIDRVADGIARLFPD